jgi:molybdenum cofactor biosynthesis protein B
VEPEHVASIRGGNAHYVALSREYMKRGFGVAPEAPRIERPAHAGGHAAVGCAIVTVSDTRTKQDDLSGDALNQGLLAAGHTVVARAWVRDQVTAIRRAVRAALAKRAVSAVILTGGTGVAPRDVTPQALEPIITMPLPGFGEVLRALSYPEIGSAAWLSRTTAGIARGKLVICLPGSPAAVRFALEKLIVGELPHVMRLLGRIPVKE